MGDYPSRLDANQLRRQLIEQGRDPGSVRQVLITHGSGDQSRTDTAELVASPDPRYGARLWLLCPRCGSRRVHLYHVRSGLGCRSCLGIGYRRT